MKRNEDSFLYDVPNHLHHKKILIDLIKEIPQNKLNSISHTDWNLPDTLLKKWKNYFLQNIYESWKSKFENVTHEKIHLWNCWFQWYDKNDFHVWHVHGKTHFTNIYYLNLPNKETMTKIKNFNGEKIIDVNEGQILTIPAYWKHQSPVNLFEDAKIIISFNTEIKND